MDVILYSLFIWPIQAAVEFLYLVMNQAAGHHMGETIILLSLAVNILILPVYLVADRWQKEEKALMASMAPKLADIKAVFRGDERQMITGTYYRQRGYHPFLSLRSSVGLLIQIPFFLAAYNVLSHADGLKTSVSVLQDLSLPDHLLHVGDVYINLLPLLMTAINLLSAGVYAKNLRPRDHIQLYVVAAVFLVLLYNSPSGLVLYWTVNNLFSLAKNLVLRTSRPGRTFHILAAVGTGLLGLLLAFLSKNLSVAWILGILGAVGTITAAPRVWKALLNALVRSEPGLIRREQTWFRVSGVALFLLSGVAVPLLFVAASPADVPSGGFQVFRTAAQMFSLFVLLPLGLWSMAPGPVRRLLCRGLGTLALASFVFAFIAPPKAVFNASFTVTNPGGLSDALGWAQTGAALAVTGAAVFLAVWFRKESWLTLAMGIGSAGLVLVAAVTALSVPSFSPPADPDAEAAKAVTPVFHLTKTGLNQFMIFIDGSPAASFPAMLARVPGFQDALDGFTWYANTVSYAPNTYETTPSLMGGPAYTPDAINARKGVPLVQKHNEALRTMPALLGAAGERVVLTDPQYISYDYGTAFTEFQDLPGVEVYRLHGKYTKLHFDAHPYGMETSPTMTFDYDVLARFSLFRMAPPVLRPALYDNGHWWIVSSGSHISDFVTGGYPNLVFLPQLCKIDEGPGSANFFFSEVYHDGDSFDAQGQIQSRSVEVPAEDLDRYGNVFSARNIYNGMANMARVRDWLVWLKKEGLYDRTRIMVAADHGHPLDEEKFGTHPWFRPLILFKDYDSRGPLKTNEELKTDADVPSMLTSGMPHGIPPRPAGDIPLVHEGDNHPTQDTTDSFFFTKTMTLAHPDSRVAANWVDVNP